MKIVKIKYVDFWPNFKPEEDLLYQLLIESPEYKVLISDKPDYVIYSVFGYEHLKYNCIRIFYTGEEICPNFNVCDYGVGFEYLTFEDRYFRLPLMYEPRYYSDYMNMMKRPTELDQNRGFCSFVYSNSEADSYRTEFFNMLSKYKQVSSGGKVLNNVGGPVASKLDFERKYKFSIAFENVRHKGYTTEKLMQSFAAGGVPIYCGDPLVANMFNAKAFINVNNYASFEEAIEYIKYVDQHTDEYLKLLKETPLREEYKLETIKKQYSEFVRNIFNQERNAAERTSRKMFNAKYVKLMKNKEDLYRIIAPLRKIWNIIKK